MSPQLVWNTTRSSLSVVSVAPGAVTVAVADAVAVAAVASAAAVPGNSSRADTATNSINCNTVCRTLLLHMLWQELKGADDSLQVSLAVQMPENG